MRPRTFAAAATALVFLTGAAVVLLLQVRVHDGAIAASCGAPFDVISGRADWQTWYAADLDDPRLGPQPSALIRTESCPAAVNGRTLAAGGLGAIALVAGAATLLFAATGRRSAGHARLHALGAWVTGIGTLLTGAGLVALIVLLADPSAPLFLYVDRWVVATVGLIVLIPAIALAAGGRALMLVSRSSDEEPKG
jgi:hypothetical protein